jgi:hypothetical protein
VGIAVRRTSWLWIRVLALLVAALPPGSALAESCTFDPGEPRPAWLTPWSDEFPEVVTDLQRGQPLVALVYVPLCSNDQVDCGSTAAGRAGDLSTNLYWGAGFGVAKFFDRPHSSWQRVQLSTPGGGVLEQRIYRRALARATWAGAFERSSCTNQPSALDEYVVFRAIHGDRIDDAVREFWRSSTQGAEVLLPSASGPRSAKVHVVGYAGHNRLMDGLELPTASATKNSSSRAPASFVLACYSESYFSDSLRGAGSQPLVMTRALMAPEGYVVDAVLRALGDNATHTMLRKRVVGAYARWQQIPEQRASLIFAR